MTSTPTVKMYNFSPPVDMPKFEESHLVLHLKWEGNISKAHMDMQGILKIHLDCSERHFLFHGYKSS